MGLVWDGEGRVPTFEVTCEGNEQPRSGSHDERVTTEPGRGVPKAAAICLVKRTQGQRPAYARMHTGGTLVIPVQCPGRNGA